jgi:hypothetical protein
VPSGPSSRDRRYLGNLCETYEIDLKKHILLSATREQPPSFNLINEKREERADSCDVAA